MSQEKMTQDELVEALRQKTNNGISKTDIKRVLAGLPDVFIEQLKAGRSVPLQGVGTFKPVDKPERMGRNPKTGETMPIPAHRAVQFKAGSGFKSAVKG